jgi:hypothetical protein
MALLLISSSESELLLAELEERDRCMDDEDDDWRECALGPAGT